MPGMKGAVAGAAGVAVALIAAALVPYTSALAAPMAFFEPFRSLGSPGAGVLAWDVLVVFGLALAVPTVAVLLPLLRAGLASRWVHLAVFFLVCVACIRFVLPAALGWPIVLPTAWWQVSPEVTLLLATALVWRLRALWPKNSSNPRPLRGAP